MSDDESQTGSQSTLNIDTERWLKAIVTPSVVAIVVGMASAYLTASTALATHEERLRTHEAYIEQHHSRLDALETDERHLSDQVIRLEHAIDRLEAQMEGE